MLVGAINWGLIAIHPDNNIVTYIFNNTIFTSIIYSIIGLAGIIGTYLWLSYPSQIASN
jgi:uncharacterized membrane protein YuzA (DUF378 family)